VEGEDRSDPATRHPPEGRSPLRPDAGLMPATGPAGFLPTGGSRQTDRSDGPRHPDPRPAGVVPAAWDRPMTST
jgi:hypothetical protein